MHGVHIANLGLFRRYTKRKCIYDRYIATGNISPQRKIRLQVVKPAISNRAPNVTSLKDNLNDSLTIALT